jgi:hypothetical protein
VPARTSAGRQWDRRGRRQESVGSPLRCMPPSRLIGRPRRRQAIPSRVAQPPSRGPVPPAAAGVRNAAGRRPRREQIVPPVHRRNSGPLATREPGPGAALWTAPVGVGHYAR